MNPNNPTGQCFSQTGVSLAPDQLPLPGSEWRTPPLFPPPLENENIPLSPTCSACPFCLPRPSPQALWAAQERPTSSVPSSRPQAARRRGDQ